ncbi:MAG: ComEC/Rec2 family competence protein [Patescibacteria group bacterium]
MALHSVFFIFIAGFTSGIAFRSFFDLGVAFALFAVFLSVALFLYVRFVSHKGSVFMGAVAIGILAAGVGMLRFDIADRGRGDPLLDTLIEQRVEVQGVVVLEPDEREFNTRLIVALATVKKDTQWKEVKSKIILSAAQYPEYDYGDRVQIAGVLKKPKNFTSGTGREFNYEEFLGKDDIYYELAYPEIELLGKGEGNIVKGTLLSLKHSFLERISRVIPEPHASLLGGLVVGAKTALGKDLLDDFRRAGIIHIVVLSGYNITIVAEAIMRFFSFLPRIAGMWLGVISIVFFAVMTGAGATIVRASLMALLVILARATGRTHDITIALFLAGFLMLLHNPKILMFDPSFQLSFLATLGLIYGAPLIEKYFHLVPTRFQLREFATATIATQIFVLPLLLYMTGEFSMVALPVNLLVLVFIPLTMLFGFLTGVVGFVSTTLSVPFAAVSYLFLTYELQVVEFFSSLPFASVSVSYFPLWLLVILYILISAIIFRFYKNTRHAEH